MDNEKENVIYYIRIGYIFGGYSREHGNLVYGELDYCWTAARLQSIASANDNNVLGSAPTQ